MTRFLARRLLHAALVLFGVSLLSFLLLRAAPGDYYASLRLNPDVSPATVAALQAAAGEGRSFPARYWHWLRRAARGDFGFSLAYGEPVGELIFRPAENTLLLSGAALALAWLLSLPLGIWMAERRGRWGDRAAGGGLSALLAIPDVLLALALLLLAFKTGWFPVAGMSTRGAAAWPWPARVADLVRHMALPTVALVAGLLPVLARHARAAMVEALDSPHLLAAAGLGVPRSRLLWRHALPAAANPLISLFGVSLGWVLGGSLIVEVILSWPGLGPLLLEAVLNRDANVVIAAVLLGAVFFLAGGLVADLWLYRLDPRTRAV